MDQVGAPVPWAGRVCQVSGRGCPRLRPSGGPSGDCRRL